MAGLHMRTWLHALPPEHHALAASSGWVPWDSPLHKTRDGAGSAGSPYALANLTGCPEGVAARRTGRALA